MSHQPPPFPSFARPPQPHYFPPTGTPPQGVFGGPPPPHHPQFSLSPFPPFSAGGRGLPTSAYPPPFRAPLPPPPWQQQQQKPPELPSPQWRPEAPPYIPGEKPRFQPPERPSPQWRPEALPFVAGEKPRLPLGHDAAASSGGLRRSDGGDESEQWLSRFLACRRTEDAGAASPPKPSGLKPSQAGLLAAEALRLVAQVAALCGAWRRRDDHAKAEEVAEAEARLAELREVVRPLRVEAAAAPVEAPLAQLRRHAEKSRKKRLRRQARRQEARAAREEEAAREAEREARIESWRARRAQEVEERHREQELKAAADSVLSEVRKKQADTKRMAEILRGLEKLRKLRKEAAARKGVCPPPDADEAFENEVQSLRALIKTRTELYEAEERALRVMLEGEQEEERKREMEKKLKREKEKVLQQKREMDSKLFGDPEEFPLARLLEPFTQYYLQAEYSVPSLIQIRHEWDRYLVPTDHPEGNFIPPGWVIPCQPSSDIWATAVG
nr:programmed cell death protein 7 [Zootoca vivipara]